MRFVILASLVFSALTAEATPRAIQRNHLQRARIAEGVRSGELTRPEARRLRAGQRRVHRIERRAVADGVVTDKEKARIETAQDVQSARIYNQKHDDQDRGE